MKKELKNTKKTKKYLESLHKIYLIGCWAHYGVREYPFTGKYSKNGTMPLVYDYDDHNGTCDSWFLRELVNTTTGAYVGFSFSKERAEIIADALNTYRNVTMEFSK